MHSSEISQNGNIESIAEFDAGATGLTVVYKDTEYLQLTDTARQTTYQYSEYPADMIKEVKVYKDYCIVFIRGADSKSYFTLINKQGKQLFEPIKYTDIIFGSSPITLSEDRLIYKEESKMSNLFDVCRIFDLSGKELFSIDYIDSDEVVEFQNGITVNKNKIYDKFGNELAITIK